MEATIAVLIVSGSLLVVYSRQVDRGISPSDYFASLEGQILADVSEERYLRLAALNVYDDEDEDDEDDTNFVKLNDFVATKIPEAFGYSLQVCELSNTADYCNMDYVYVVATKDKDIFTEEIMIAAELGSGGSDAIHKPKKVKLYIWEGDVEVSCSDDTGCYEFGAVRSCNAGNTKVMITMCEDTDGDGCLDAGVKTMDENCEAINEVCDYSTGVAACIGNEASLEASINMNTIIVSYDGDSECYYNKCTYDVSVSNTGDVSGIVWKRVVSGDANVEEIYNQVVSPGDTINPDSEQKYGASKCYTDQFYNVNIYNDNGDNIGEKSFTCSHS